VAMVEAAAPVGAAADISCRVRHRWEGITRGSGRPPAFHRLCAPDGPGRRALSEVSAVFIEPTAEKASLSVLFQLSSHLQDNDHNQDDEQDEDHEPQTVAGSRQLVDVAGNLSQL